MLESRIEKLISPLLRHNKFAARIIEGKVLVKKGGSGILSDYQHILKESVTFIFILYNDIINIIKYFNSGNITVGYERKNIQEEKEQ